MIFEAPETLVFKTWIVQYLGMCQESQILRPWAPERVDSVATDVISAPQILTFPIFRRKLTLFWHFLGLEIRHFLRKIQEKKSWNHPGMRGDTNNRDFSSKSSIQMSTQQALSYSIHQVFTWAESYSIPAHLAHSKESSEDLSLNYKQKIHK